MRPPKRVQLGYAPIRVHHQDGQAAWGHFSADRQALGIDSSQLPADQLNCAYHEVFHAIVQRSATQLPDDLEEQLARVVGNYMAELHVRNPRLSEWLEYLAVRVREDG